MSKNIHRFGQNLLLIVLLVSSTLSLVYCPIRLVQEKPMSTGLPPAVKKLLLIPDPHVFDEPAYLNQHDFWLRYSQNHLEHYRLQDILIGQFSWKNRTERVLFWHFAKYSGRMRQESVKKYLYYFFCKRFPREGSITPNGVRLISRSPNQKVILDLGVGCPTNENKI